MRKHALSLMLAIALCEIMPSSSSAITNRLEVNQNTNIVELLARIEKQFDVHFNYESALKLLKIKDDYSLENLRKSDIESFVQDVTLQQIKVDKIGEDSYIIRRAVSVVPANKANVRVEKA